MPKEDRMRWNQRFREEGWDRDPSPFLVSLDAVLPHRGRALDLAGGPGRNALWLARRGLDTTMLDISDVALDMARQAAEKSGLSIELVETDLETDPIPPGPWDVVICFNYLRRPLLKELSALLKPSGLAILELATKVNLERHERPPPRHLLDRGEILTLLPGLDLVVYRERWWHDRHVAHVAATPLPS